MTAPVNIALSHARKGRPVLPLHITLDPDRRVCSCRMGVRCDSPGKHPDARLVPHGLSDATTDEPTIRRWWTARPQARVAMLTGKSSTMVVLDVDPRHGGDDALHDLERSYTELPRTLTICTPSGGQHIYFADPGGIRPSASKIGDGLDIRADGAYVVAAGNPGYHIDELAPLARMPAWLERLARGPTTKPQEPKPAEHWLQMLSGPIIEGGRNQALCSLAGHLIARRVDPRVARALLDGVNATRCHPSLADDEVEQIVASVTRCNERNHRQAAA